MLLDDSLNCEKFEDETAKNRLTASFPYNVFDLSNYEKRTESEHHSHQYSMEDKLIHSFCFTFGKKSAVKEFNFQRRLMNRLTEEGRSVIETQCFYGSDAGFLVVMRPSGLLRDVALIQRMTLELLKQYLFNLMTVVINIERAGGVLADWSVNHFHVRRENLTQPFFSGFEAVCEQGQPCQVLANSVLGTRFIKTLPGSSGELIAAKYLTVTADRKWNCLAYIWLLKEYMRRYIHAYVPKKNVGLLRAFRPGRTVFTSEVCKPSAGKNVWSNLRSMVINIPGKDSVDKDGKRQFVKGAQKINDDYLSATSSECDEPCRKKRCKSSTSSASSCTNIPKKCD